MTLPEEAIEANILSGLAHISLISIEKLSDSGCKVSFNHHNMVVNKDEEVLLQGKRDAITGLWIVPL